MRHALHAVNRRVSSFRKEWVPFVSILSLRYKKIRGFIRVERCLHGGNYYLWDREDENFSPALGRPLCRRGEGHQLIERENNRKKKKGGRNWGIIREGGGTVGATAAAFAYAA